MKKNVLLLGGYGFMGINLIEEILRSDKYNVIVFDQDSARENVKGLKLPVTDYTGDFNNKSDVEAVFAEHSIDRVFHLLSTTIPSSSNVDMIGDIRSNLIGSLNVLDLMRKYSVPNIVYVSSGGTVYGLPKALPVKENSGNQPLCSYGVVKLAMEKYLYIYERMYGIKYLILRPSNPYGEWQRSKDQGLINNILRQSIANEEIIVWGDGTIVRDYIYIKDLARIIFVLVEKGAANEVFNIGSGSGYSINDVIKIVNNIIGPIKTRYDKARSFDVQKIVLDNEKMCSFLKPDYTDLQTGIMNTYKWLKEQGTVTALAGNRIK